MNLRSGKILGQPPIQASAHSSGPLPAEPPATEPSLFLQLPLEIRNMIYKLAFHLDIEEPHITPVYATKAQKPTRTKAQRRARRANPLFVNHTLPNTTILAVCKQIFQEAYPYSLQAWYLTPLDLTHLHLRGSQASKFLQRSNKEILQKLKYVLFTRDLLFYIQPSPTISTKLYDVLRTVTLQRIQISIPEPNPPSHRFLKAFVIMSQSLTGVERFVLDYTSPQDGARIHRIIFVYETRDIPGRYGAGHPFGFPRLVTMHFKPEDAGRLFPEVVVHGAPNQELANARHVARVPGVFTW